jgi:hypothetical protein
MIAGGIGAMALVTMPDITASAQAAVGTAGQADAPAGYFFLYGIADTADHDPQFQVGASSSSARNSMTPALGSAANLSTAPVLSSDQSLLALSSVTLAAGGARVAVSVVSKASGAVTRTASFDLANAAPDAGIVVTPAFSPDLSVLSLVISITVKTNKHMVSKRDPRTGGTRPVEAGTLVSKHALAYLDLGTGSVAGPFYLGDEGTLALSTAVTTNKDLVLWTTMDPQALHMSKGYKRSAPLPSISVYPLGTATARLTAPSAGPWPGGEPAVALASGDAARLVNATTLQVVSASNGDLSEVRPAPLAQGRAKPSPVKVTSRPDGTLFLAKPAVGRAAILDPARGFQVTRDVHFPAPAKPAGGPLSKAVLSASGDILYVLGSATAGGLSGYDVASGALVASYTHGTQYTGVYLLPSGTLLAVGTENPRLSYFSPELEPLATADTSLYISEAY